VRRGPAAALGPGGRLGRALPVTVSGKLSAAAAGRTETAGPAAATDLLSLLAARRLSCPLRRRRPGVFRVIMMFAAAIIIAEEVIAE
jgi:hypothetical protein